MPWLDGLLERKHRSAATVALAHKNARVVCMRRLDATFLRST
jgi:hypothetical protein